MFNWEGRTRNDPSRRSFLRGLGGAAVLAGTGGMAGCSALGSGYSVENEIVVEDAAAHDDLGRHIDGDAYFVRPSNWDDYVGTGIYPEYFLAYPEKTVEEDSHIVDGPGGEGLIPVADDVPTLWTPGMHEETQQIPIVFDDRWTNYETLGADTNRVTVRTIVDKYNQDVPYNGPLKESWFHDFAEDDRLNLGAIDASQWINDEIALLNIQFYSIDEGGGGRPYVWFNKEF